MPQLLLSALPLPVALWVMAATRRPVSRSRTPHPAAVLGVIGSLAAGHAIAPLPLADEATRRAALGSALYLGLIGLLALGVGLIVRDTAGALTTVLALLYVAPMIASLIADPKWTERLQRASPTAGLSIQATKGLDTLPIGPWAGLGVLAAYAGGALLLGLLVLLRRDA